MILGFISDAHGNREAFDVGIGLLRGSGAETIYFLGDAVGYLPGDDVIGAIRSAHAIPVLGNHDAMLLEGRVDPDRDELFRTGQTLRMSSNVNLKFLATWPDRRSVEAPIGRLLLVHGSPADPLGGYIYPDTEVASLAPDEATFVFMGQTHRPFVRRGGPTTYVNVGSCGLPRDCGHLGAACVFDSVSGEVEILRFDIQAATRAALERCGPVAPDVLAVFDRRGPDCHES